MTIQQFVDKWFKHWVHREWVDMYFKVRGVSRKNLWRYIQANFWDTRTYNGHFYERMTVDEMDQYMEDLMELMD
jgi:hypothetical protein